MTFLAVRWGDTQDVETRAAYLEGAMNRLANTAWGGFEVVSSSDACCILLPMDRSGGVAVDLATGNAGLVVAYGEADDPRGGGLARQLHERCEREGVEYAAMLPGCYGAAIYRSADRSLTLVSDGLAQRSLRSASLGDMILVSPHDLALVAAGVPVEPQPVSIASMFRFGWSFGGESLIRGIDVVPAEQIRLFGPDRQARSLPHPNYVQAQVQRRDDADAGLIGDRIIDSMVGYLRANHEAGERIAVELSAGFDSRAVLALALAAYREDVQTFTDGPRRSQDVRVATRVAAAVGVDHRGGGVRTSTAEERLQAVAALASATNGQATVMPVMSGSFIDRPAAESLGGDGGEFLRGDYYPRLGTEEARAVSLDHLTQYVMDKFRLGAPWLGSESDGCLRELVARRLRSLAPYCRRNSDAYDLIYLLERAGIWNQKLRRMSSRRLSPFFSRAATFEFLTLPGVRGRAAIVHRVSMARHLDRARWIPLNGETLPVLLSGGTFARRIARLSTLAAKAMWKVLDRFGLGRGGTGVNDLEQARNEVFSQHLADGWFALLEADDSVCRSTLGAGPVDALLEAVRGGNYAAAQVVATLVVVETFFEQARHVAHAPQPLVSTRS